jgi:GGDEF domain-containing protein
VTLPPEISESEGQLLYLAENLTSLYASPDMQWLAGRFEFLGEKALGAALSLLAIVDEAGTYRPVPVSAQAPASIRALREDLRVAELASNADAASVLAQVERQGRAMTLPVGALFGIETEEVDGASAIVVPVAHNREPIGAAMFVAGASARNEQVAQILASHTAVAIYLLRQREEAGRLHSVDPILWIPDEDFMVAQLKREVGVAVLRLANEREIRRQFGDFFTDHLMRRIGSHVLAQVRDSDVVGALAGGYAVIHNETPLDGTTLSAERLRDSMTQMVVQRFPEVPQPEVSVAVGGFPETAATVEMLLHHLRQSIASADIAA